MSTNDVISLVLSIVALVLSIASTIILIIIEKAKLKAAYREQFIFDIRKNEHLENLMKLLVTLKTDYDSGSFVSIHKSCMEYKRDYECISMMSLSFYKKLNNAITSIDDEAILASQKKLDDENYKIDFNKFEKKIRQVLSVIEKFYLGRYL